jgi:hypothetical protein
VFVGIVIALPFKNFSEKRAIMKGKLLRNPFVWFRNRQRNDILALGLTNHSQIFMIGFKMFTETDERDIHVIEITVVEGTSNGAVDTVKFMEYQILKYNDELTPIVGKPAFGWQLLQYIGNKGR